MADRFRRGGRLFTFGNGGSATDARSLASLFGRPPVGRPLPAGCLADDPAVLTALANDVGFELVFTRQLIAHAGPDDIAVGISTSGNSRNLLRALGHTARTGLLTLGLAGYDGGDMQGCGAVDACFVVESDSVHRIQEVQAALAWRRGRRSRRASTRTRPVSDAAAPIPGDHEATVLDRITAFRRRRPRLTDDVVTLAHGAGGKASAALVDSVFLDVFAHGDPGPLPDAATLPLAGGARLAFSTDSFVVQPLRFPGGSIGHLAVHGTVNDLAVQGAEPRWLSAAFVLEEGFPIDELRGIVADMADAARAAHVEIVTGDTKVVGRGAADGMFVTTAGVGVIPEGRTLDAARVQPGDVVLVSAPSPTTGWR